MMALLHPTVENVLFGNVAVGTMSWYGDDVLGTDCPNASSNL